MFVGLFAESYNDTTLKYEATARSWLASHQEDSMKSLRLAKK